MYDKVIITYIICIFLIFDPDRSLELDLNPDFLVPNPYRIRIKFFFCGAGSGSFSPRSATPWFKQLKFEIRCYGINFLFLHPFVKNPRASAFQGHKHDLLFIPTLYILNIRDGPDIRPVLKMIYPAYGLE